jgi:hypothetical protein
MIFMPFLAARKCKRASLTAPEKKQARFVDIEAKSAVEPGSETLDIINCTMLSF